MKKIASIVLGLIAGTVSVFGASSHGGVTNVEPPFWWTGMSNDTLQIMVTGPDIASADFSIDYAGVTLDRQVALDSKNYKFLYLAVAPDTKPGKIDIRYRLGGRKSSFPYELKARDRAASEYKGFDAGDVLYLLMPDRFAKGLDDNDIDI